MSKEHLRLIEGEGIPEPLSARAEVESVLTNHSEIARRGLNDAFAEAASVHKDFKDGTIDCEDARDVIDRTARYVSRNTDLIDIAGVTVNDLLTPGGAIHFHPTVAKAYDEEMAKPKVKSPGKFRSVFKKMVHKPESVDE